MRHVKSKAKDCGRVIEYEMMTSHGILWLGEDNTDVYLEIIDTFYVERLGEMEICMSVRKEIRSGKVHWYAYKRFAGKLHKAYVGQFINFRSLWDAATKLPTAAFGRGTYNANRRKPN